MCNKFISKGILTAVAVLVILSGMVLGCKQATGGDSTPTVETIRWVQSSGSYEFKTNDTQYYNYFFTRRFADKSVASDTLSVSATKLSGSDYSSVGMICFAQDDKNYFIVLCAPLGQYEIVKYVNNNRFIVTSWTVSSAIKAKGSENILTVKPVSGTPNKYEFFINSTSVCTFDNTEFTSGGYYGFFCNVSDTSSYESFPATPVDARFKMLSPITAP